MSRYARGVWVKTRSVGDGHPHFLLVGCFGDKNAGDEAMLEASVELLRRRVPGCSITVCTNDPEDTRLRLRVSTVSALGFVRPRTLLALIRSRQLASLYRALRQCDCLVVAGGELVRTGFGLFAALSIFDKVLLARVLGKPVIMLGVGAGELEPGLTRLLIRTACRQAIICTREAESLQRLTAAGIHAQGDMPDLALAVRALPHDVGLPEGPRIAVCCRDPNGTRSCSSFRQHRASIVGLLATLADRIVAVGAIPIFVPFCTNADDDDRLFHREIVEHMQHGDRAFLVERVLCPGQLKGLIGDVDVVVGMRLHSCLFGLATLRPTLAVAYDDKVTKCMQRFGVGHWTLGLAEIGKAPELLLSLWQDCEHWGPLRQRLADDLQELAHRFDSIFGQRAGTPGTPLTVSVVIITYDHGSCVRRAIHSVLAQSYPPNEVIVVDDGSSDGTGELIQAEFGSRVLYQYQQNKGPSGARNRGIKLSTCEWIAFLDADDEWVPEKLELQMAELRKNPSVEMVACECLRSDSHGTTRISLPQPLTQQQIVEELKRRTLFGPGVVVRRRALVEVGGFDERLRCAEDRELWARIAARRRVAVVHRPLLKKHESESGLSSQPETLLRDTLLVNRRVLQVLGATGFLGRLGDQLTLQRADAMVFASAAHLYRLRGDHRKAAAAAWGSVCRWPMSLQRWYLLARILLVATGRNASKRVRDRRSEVAFEDTDGQREETAWVP